LKNENRLLPLQKDKIKTIAVIGPVANAVIPDWYSGKPPYKVTILDGIRNAVGEKANILYAKSNKADSAITLARQADVVVVCIGNHPICNNTGWATSYVPSDGKEAIDRQAITTEQEDLVKLVKAANPNTVLVLVSSFPFAINWSKEHVPAILHVSQSSQELGNGVADILFGNENPAGRLVQTWPASIDDLPPMLDYDITHGRTYMYSKTKPLFAFGYGLSYTTFEYSNLKLNKTRISANDTLMITFNLKNTGKMAGDEVAQVYASFPGSKVTRPKIALKGFKRIQVEAGNTNSVTIAVPASELQYWDTKANRFMLEKGKIQLAVGSASDNLKLNAMVSVD